MNSRVLKVDDFSHAFALPSFLWRIVCGMGAVICPSTMVSPFISLCLYLTVPSARLDETSPKILSSFRHPNLTQHKAGLSEEVLMPVSFSYFVCSLAVCILVGDPTSKPVTCKTCAEEIVFLFLHPFVPPVHFFNFLPLTLCSFISVYSSRK
jgi:hypothetical protein